MAAPSGLWPSDDPPTGVAWLAHAFAQRAGKLLDASQTSEAVLGARGYLGVGDVGDEVGEFGAARQRGRTASAGPVWPQRGRVSRSRI